MLPLTTITGDVDRPVAASDPDDAATLTRLFTALPAQISSPGGDTDRSGGVQEVVDAVLHIDITDPPLAVGDFFTADYGDRWRIVWARRRHGLGLDHQRAGMRSVTGSVLP